MKWKEKETQYHDRSIYFQDFFFNENVIIMTRLFTLIIY